MKARLNATIFFVLVFCFAQVGFTNHHAGKGTEVEAKVLLERAVNLMKVDEVVALTMMSIPNGGFHQKDLYPFCLHDSGVLVSHPYLLGSSLRDYVSDDGIKVGDTFIKKAKEGKIDKITYIQPVFMDGKLTQEKAKKTSFYTRVGRYICASGFYQ